MTLEPILEASPAIQIHMAAAIGSLVLGAAMLWRRKGGAVHRLNGRVWVILMAITALSGLFIHELRMWGAWSPIHLLSLAVPVFLVLGVHAARTRNLVRHRVMMRNTYAGGMLVAGGFTFLPGRINYRMLLSDGGTMPSSPNHVWMLLLISALLAGFLVWRQGARS